MLSFLSFPFLFFLFLSSFHFFFLLSHVFPIVLGTKNDSFAETLVVREDCYPVKAGNFEERGVGAPFGKRLGPLGRAE